MDTNQHAKMAIAWKAEHDSAAEDMKKRVSNREKLKCALRMETIKEADRNIEMLDTGDTSDQTIMAGVRGMSDQAFPVAHFYFSMEDHC